MELTTESLRTLLDQRFGGVLKAGKHEENGECCALELVAAARGIGWSDDPTVVRSFDLRALNDIGVSDEVRTELMVPLIAAYDGSLDWTKEKQMRVVARIVVGVVRQIIADLPDLPEAIAKRCRLVLDLTSAAAAAAAAAAYYASARAAVAYSAAADSARAAVAYSAAADSARAAVAYSAAAASARAAVYSARAAARAADAAARENVFRIACAIWLSATTAEEAA